MAGGTGQDNRSIETKEATNDRRNKFKQKDEERKYRSELQGLGVARFTDTRNIKEEQSEENRHKLSAYLNLPVSR